MRAARVSTLTVSVILFLAVAALSALIDLESFEAEGGDPDLALGSYTHPAGGLTRDLTVGIGSAAYRGPFDIFPFAIFDWPFSQSRHAAVDAFWTLSDRGPNFQCDEAELVIALAPTSACPEVPNVVAAGIGRIYPRPDYSPSIFRVVLRRDGTFRVAKTIPLRTRHGHPVLGLPNPLTIAVTEVHATGPAT